jgi:2-dehydropantoate 2-reductase
MRIAIIGAGAMGSLFGGRISRAGHEVLLFDPYQEHVDAVNTAGLAIEDAATGAVAVCRPLATATPGDVRSPEVMVFFVKSTVTALAARQFQASVGPRTIVVTLQNGLGNESILAEVFGAGRTAAGVTSQGATFLGPGRIRHAGTGPTHLGMSDGSSGTLAPFAAVLGEAGFETHVEGDVKGLIWSKLLINVGINALTALTGVPNGRLLDFPETRALMEDLVSEAAAVARARGITLTYPDPLQTVRDVARKTGANRSSMLQDFDRGRETEIDFINGAIVREAAALGMSVPVNTAVLRLVKALDRVHQERKS